MSRPAVLLHPRAGIAVAAGTALACSFPTFDQSSLAWLAPGLMLLGGLGTTGRRAFGFGYLAGLVHYLVSLRWLLNIPFPAGAIAAWLALSAYLALYPAVWVWFCTRILPGARGAADSGAPRDALASHPRLAAVLRPILDRTWTERTLWCLGAAAAWVAIEMILGRFLTGFPWNFLGVSQYQAVPLIQIAAATGVYGVSFLVAWGSCALLTTALVVTGQIVRAADVRAAAARPGSRGGWPLPRARSLAVSFRLSLLAELALPLVVLVVITVSGGMRLLTPAPAGPELRVAVVQPSIPQKLIFDPRETTNRFNTIMELSRLALAAQPDLLVWPEASLPNLELAHYQALTNLIARHRAWMVFGADDTEALPEPGGATTHRYFNSAFLFDPEGRFASTYRKRRLVIFGEYVPLERWLPLAKYLTPIEGSFTPGTQPAWFQLQNPAARVAPLICFEDVFAGVAREAVDPETDFLLNLTNNGWFGEGAAQWQQAANAVFRAVENRVPLVRCTNNGLTCWVDAWGRLREVGLGTDRDAYGAGFRVFRVPLHPPGQPRDRTFYQTYGDLFGWICVGVTCALGSLRWRRG